MKNNKGFTLVEVLVSLSLVAVIAIFLFQIIYLLRDIYVEKAVKSELYIESSNLSNVINKEIVTKENDNVYVKLINKKSDDEVAITYSDNTKTSIKINRENHTISFGNYNIKVLSKADIGNMEVYYNYEIVDLDKNGVCNIKIPITHKDYPNDFGVIVTYRYDSSKTTVNGDISLSSNYECNLPVGTSWDFAYNGTNGTNGSIQNFTVSCTGTYKLEVWGAQGGSGYNSNSGTGGYGGYSVGNTRLFQGNILYIGVGGQGLTGTSSGNDYTGGYNGGGTSHYWIDGTTYNGSGGGATHIALNENLGELSYYNSARDKILIVAGGGGGGASNATTHAKGGHGGGFKGTAGKQPPNNDGSYGLGGTQTAGGSYVLSTRATPNAGTFGAGGNSSLTNASNAGGGSGGGAGFFGGGAGGVWGGAGGGSGYIANDNLTEKHMACSECERNDDTSTKTIIATGVSDEAVSDYSKKGNGHAKITLIAY